MCNCDAIFTFKAIGQPYASRTARIRSDYLHVSIEDNGLFVPLDAPDNIFCLRESHPFVF